MANDEIKLEKQIQDEGLTAERVTPQQIDAKIVSEDYYVFPGTTVSVCCLTLENGFNVIGESAAAHPDNFNEKLGRQIAKDHARSKIWALEGYLLREKLSKEGS